MSIPTMEPGLDVDELIAALLDAGELLEHASWPSEGEMDLDDREGSFAGYGMLGSLRDVYGVDRALLRERADRYLRLARRFRSAFGGGPVVLVRVPARINIIGEHVDYVRYIRTQVFPFGSRERDMIALFRPREDDVVRARTTLEEVDASRYGQREFRIGEFPLDTGLARASREERDRRWLDYLNTDVKVPVQRWDNYLKGSAYYLQNMHPQRTLRGMDMMIDSSITVAGGVSSSSALVVISGLAIRLVNRLPVDLEELADASSKAEWYVGTRGGKMDQATISLAQASCGLQITFEPFGARPVPLPTEGYRWVTFYTAPHSGGSQIASQYNERSAISRYVIPAMLDRLLRDRPSLGRGWEALRRAFEDNDLEALEALSHVKEQVLEALPEAISLGRVQEEYPDAFAEIAKEREGAYRALFEVYGLDGEMEVRSRARHHLEDVTRVIRAVQVTQEAYAEYKRGNALRSRTRMEQLGKLLDESHAGLDRLYGLSTPDLNEIVAEARGFPGVLGARLMGGGFGGTALVLVDEEGASGLIRRIQESYYRPRGRDGAGEDSVVVSTPGRGASAVLPARTIRGRAAQLIADWRAWGENEREIERLWRILLGIRRLSDFEPPRPIRPLIPCGGRGSRASRSGIQGVRALVEVDGKLAIVHTLDILANLKRLCPSLRLGKPIIVVRADGEDEGQGTEGALREALAGRYEAEYVRQDRPLGSGHAVYSARAVLEGYQGELLCVLPEQVVIRPETYFKAILGHYAMGASATFPTAGRTKPYAYLKRDFWGRVVDLMETHMGAPRIPFGEDNIGMWIFNSSALFRALEYAHGDPNWVDPATGEYRTSNKELPLTTVVIHAMNRLGEDLQALALADEREAQGIKELAHVPLVERYIEELSAPETVASTFRE